VSATVEEIEGPYPSPTLLINGADVSGRRAEVAPSCRLDVPGAGQILAALQIRDRVPDEGGWYLARRTNVVGPKRSSQDSTLGVPLA
jgi:hypothetical protein